MILTIALARVYLTRLTKKLDLVVYVLIFIAVDYLEVNHGANSPFQDLALMHGVSRKDEL